MLLILSNFIKIENNFITIYHDDNIIHPFFTSAYKMSCVWKGLIDALDLNISPESLCATIQSKNRDTPDMLWNGETLSDQLQKENQQTIKELDSDDVKKGYLCSTCDPLLLLVGQLYDVSIDHLYAGITIRYINTKSNRKIFVMSNQGHFWADKQQIKAQKRLERQNKGKEISKQKEYLFKQAKMKKNKHVQKQ